MTAERGESVRTTSCGVFDLPIGMGAAPRGPVFSDEIMHGLGPGPVCVQVGVEYITTNSSGEANGELLFGDTSIFSADRESTAAERAYQLTTAVKVLPERGTFIVGLRLAEETGLISLRIRWFAFRAGELDKQFRPSRAGEPMLLVNPDTIVLQPKTTAHISPVFINMPGEACTFTVTDPEGGSIDNNGTYTAPAREGVYEIRIEAMSDPTVFTYAFAIVSQKKKETSGESAGKNLNGRGRRHVCRAEYGPRAGARGAVQRGEPHHRLRGQAARAGRPVHGGLRDGAARAA